MALPTPTNIPVSNLPILYTNNMQISWASNTTLSVAAGQKRDSTNTIDMTTTSAKTINFATTGVNALDQGTIAASTLYYIYSISDSTGKQLPGFLASTSATSPYMPYNYDAAALEAVWYTDGSSHLILGYVIGSGNQRKHYLDTIVSVLSGGASASLALIDLSSCVPPIENTLVSIEAEFTPATASDYASFAPGVSTATVLPRLRGVVAAKVNSGEFEILAKLVSSKAQIQYINSAASGATTVYVKGFTYFV